MADLKLLALDSQDLEVISSCCQDAIMKIGDLNFLPNEQRFMVSMNRFAWETHNDAATERERRRSVLHFERVSGVKLLGIDRTEKDMVLSLLAIIFVPEDGPAGQIELVFSGDGAIRLQVECIEAQLADQPARWSAKSVPTHE